MTSSWRIALLAFPLLVVGGLLAAARWWPVAKDSNEVAARTVSVTMANGDCRKCHESVWREWESSLHSQSFVHENVQAAFRHFGHDRQCESCHAPEPVLPDLTASVVLRPDDRESGVNCLTCHALPDGSMAARRTIADAPCRPVDTPALLTSASCGSCHVAIHKDWEASNFVTTKNCADCHMPAVADRPNGRSHLCLGGHDEALVRSAAKMECRIEGDQLLVTVENDTAAHNFPGERHNRVLLLQVIERSAGGEITLAQQKTIKAITPFRGESSAEQIKSGDTFQATFPVVKPAAKAQVQLLYKLFPWYPDRDALVVHEQELSLP